MGVEIPRRGPSVHGRAWDIAQMMAREPETRLREIGRALSVDLRTVAGTVRLMKRMGMVEFVGPRRDGEWRVSQDAKRALNGALKCKERPSENDGPGT